MPQIMPLPWVFMFFSIYFSLFTILIFNSFFSLYTPTHIKRMKAVTVKIPW